MLALPGSIRCYLYSTHTDMRKGFDSLSGIIRHELKSNPLSGDIFIFMNRRRNQIKLLHWEGDGFSIYYKRLERGSYEIPNPGFSTGHMELSSQELLLILQGICLNSVRKRKRYQHQGEKN